MLALDGYVCGGVVMRGEVFVCLTDPPQNDNPLVLALDGYVCGGGVMHWGGVFLPYRPVAER